jgi:hypothetical protein
MFGEGRIDLHENLRSATELNELLVMFEDWG